jgi:hypothetical protein
MKLNDMIDVVPDFDDHLQALIVRIGGLPHLVRHIG